MDHHTLSTDDSPLQDELLERLLRCRPGDREVAAFASTVKQHCGYFRSDVRNLLRQRGLADVEESDVTDPSWTGDGAFASADLAGK